MNKILLIFFILIVHNLSAQEGLAFEYESEDLKIKGIAENVYIHITYLETESFGRVGCNGAIFFDKEEAIVFDTPTNDEVSEELIRWIKEERGKEIKAIVVTHFHEDCLGGLNAFHKHGIRSYASEKTIKILKESEEEFYPAIGFNDKMKIEIGAENVILKYYGEGHTIDNIVGYIPSKETLFGGCLIKKVDASKGYLGDANIESWSHTVSLIKKDLPNLKYVIPGHGKHGGTELLDYTIDLFNDSKGPQYFQRKNE